MINGDTRELTGHWRLSNNAVIGQVRSHIQKFFQCTVTKTPTPTERPPMRHLLAFQPLERLAIDFEKLDAGKGNIEDVLVLTDSFTKFAQAIPCKNQTAPTVARALRDHWFCHYGIPAQIHSDQGKNFESQLIRELCSLYNITKTRTTAYHPQGNGQTERFNRTLCSLIKSLDAKSRYSWPELLPHLVFIYNTTPHSITGYTPYTLMFGRDPVVPIDQLLSNTRSDWSEPAIKKQAQIIKATHQLVKERLTKAAAANKRNYDKCARAGKISVGDRVLVKQMAHKERHKLANIFYEQTYVVVQCNLDGDLFLVRPAEGGNSKWLNRKLLILDPRRESTLKESEDPLQGLPGLFSSDPPHSEPLLDSDDSWVITYDQKRPALPHDAQPNGQKERVPSRTNAPIQPSSHALSENTAGPRRSQRLQAKRCGKWPNSIT